MIQVEVAEAAGVTPATFSRYETNDIPPPDYVIDRLANLFRVPRGFIRYGDTSSRMAPIVGYVGAGAEVFPVDEDLDLGGVEVPGSWTDAAAFEIRGDSMLPIYQDGGRIVVRGEPRFVAEEALRRICVLQTAEGRSLVKEVRRTPDPTLFDLQSPNASTIENQIVTSARPVIAYFAPPTEGD